MMHHNHMMSGSQAVCKGHSDVMEILNCSMED